VDSTDASAFDYRAGAYLKLGRHAEAIRDLSASIAITPGNKWALASRASARAEIKDYHGALTDADAALGLMPEDEASHSAKIAALSGLKKFDEALSAVDTWEQVAGKKTARTESKRAQILATKGYARSAVEALDRAILLDPDYAWAYSYRGFLKWQDFNNATAALEDFEIAIALGDASARRYKQRILDSRRR
jgi:tetratricopeptide (TPR) repeat protein